MRSILLSPSLNQDIWLDSSYTLQRHHRRQKDDCIEWLQSMKWWRKDRRERGQSLISQVFDPHTSYFIGKGKMFSHLSQKRLFSITIAFILYSLFFPFFHSTHSLSLYFAELTFCCLIGDSSFSWTAGLICLQENKKLTRSSFLSLLLASFSNVVVVRR